MLVLPIKKKWVRMNNKTNIEEDIKILEEIINDYKFKYYYSQYL